MPSPSLWSCSRLRNGETCYGEPRSLSKAARTTAATAATAATSREASTAAATARFRRRASEHRRGCVEHGKEASAHGIEAVKGTTTHIVEARPIGNPTRFSIHWASEWLVWPAVVVAIAV